MRHKYTRICGILFLLTLAMVLTDTLMTGDRNLRLGPTLVLEQAERLPVVLDGDTTFVSLAKGDSVRILGFRRLTYGQSVLVQTPAGDRGMMDASQLPLRQIVVEGEHKGDTLVNLRPEYLGLHVHKYDATTAGGEEFELRGQDFTPLVEGWKDINLDNNASTSVATQKGLEKMKGRTLEEIEAKYGPAYNILVARDGSKRASFLIYTYGNGGVLTKPVISFDAEGKATAFAYKAVTGKAKNGWVLSIAPFAATIIDMPLTRALTRTDAYSDPNHTGESVPWYMYVAVVAVLAMWLLWYCMTPSLGVLLVGWLIACPVVFKPLSNKALKAIITVLGVVGTYWWAIALMAWGLYWFMVLPVIAVSYYCMRWAKAYLWDGIPHARCPQCRHIHTISYDRSVVTGTKYMKGRDIRRNKILSEHFETWQSWTQVTERWSDGRERSYRENERNHKRRHRLCSYIDYEVTYLVTFYDDFFSCDHCGFTEKDTHITSEEVDRKEVGTHTDVESDDIY